MFHSLSSSFEMSVFQETLVHETKLLVPPGLKDFATEPQTGDVKQQKFKVSESEAHLAYPLHTL